MTRIGNKDYKLLLLDTNALREIVTNHSYAGRGFLTKFFIDSDDYAPCFSMYSIIELHPYEDIYNRFLDFFDVMPSMLFMSCRQIFQYEYTAFLDGKPMPIDLNVARTSSPFFKDKDLMLRSFLEHSWRNQSFVDALTTEMEGLKKVALDWEIQRSSIKRNSKSSMNNAFYLQNEKATVKKDLVNWGVEIQGQFDHKQLPSARMMEYTHFRKVHVAQKKITQNDAMDVVISCIVPYVDAVITEASQADVFKQAAKIIPQMQGKELYTLRDIRENPERPS